jgi:hypothetical protein
MVSFKGIKSQNSGFFASPHLPLSPLPPFLARNLKNLLLKDSPIKLTLNQRLIKLVMDAN